MPKYLVTGSYTAAGIKGVLSEGGTSRGEAVRKVVESVGGTLESCYWGFGGDDFFVTCELPGNEAAAAVAMTVAASGAVNSRTVVLLTADEVDAATKLSPAYRAPGT